MSADLLFQIANNIALVSWLLLIVFGRKAWVSSLTAAVVVPALFAIAYVFLFVLHGTETSGSFNSLAGVAALFSNRWLLLAGWIHYLAFDLFVGSWEVRDAVANRISHWLVIPCLLLTFLLGPAGFLLYLLLRASLRRRTTIA